MALHLLIPRVLLQTVWPAAHDTVQASIHLSTPFMDASFELSKAMSGAKRQRERWPRLSETRVLPLQTFQKQNCRLEFTRFWQPWSCGLTQCEPPIMTTQAMAALRGPDPGRAAVHDGARVRGRGVLAAAVRRGARHDRGDQGGVQTQPWRLGVDGRRHEAAGPSDASYALITTRARRGHAESSPSRCDLGAPAILRVNLRHRLSRLSSSCATGCTQSGSQYRKTTPTRNWHCNTCCSCAAHAQRRPRTRRIRSTT